MIQDSGAQSGSVIILTDGQNVGSVAKPGEVLAALKAAHVRVFAVGLQSPAYQAGPLKQMASGTGGDYVEANTPEALRPLVASIGRQLAREFLLQYQTRQNPNTKVDVRVKVAGVPGVATSQYETPKLVIKPVPPYRPSTFDRVAQSRWTMLAVALIIAALVGWAVRSFTSQRDDALVDRVSGFVAVPPPALRLRPIPLPGSPVRIAAS